MNILVPTDFSKYADYAFEVACQVARSKGASLHLYHSADIPEEWETLPIDTKIKDRINQYTALEAKEKLIQLKTQAVERDVHTTFHYTGGAFTKNIHKILEKEIIDLIVLGSHGASGKEEWFLGSNSQRIIRKVRKNALIIKEPVQEFLPQKVAFVTGLNEEDQEGFRSFLKFISDYNPMEVHVLTIDTSAWFTQPTIVMIDALKDFKQIATEFNCTTHFYNDHSIQAGIRHFVSEFNIDLIGISYVSRNPIKRLFLGSNVEMLVNQSRIPVLCINNPLSNNTLSRD